MDNPQINISSDTWRAVSSTLKEERVSLIQSLIRVNDEIVRAKIQAIDDILDLPNK